MKKETIEKVNNILKTIIDFTIGFIIFAVFWAFFILLLTSCKTKYIPVPVETTKTEKEYVDRWLRDSIYVHDSISLFQKGDTVWLEKYKTIYKEKLKKDSIYITDSVRVEVPVIVEVPKEINRLHNWQVVFMILGGAFVVYIGFRIYRKFKP